MKHGLTAKTAVLPGEDHAQFQALVDHYQVDLETRNELEDDLAENVALGQWQIRRSTDVERARINHEMLTRKDANRLRDAIAAAEIRDRLFYDRQGPIELYPSGSCDWGGPRTSCSKEPDDPLNPTVLIFRAENTVAGCQMLRGEWEALRRNLLAGMCIKSHEKLKMLRLMGKQPLRALGDPDVAQVFLACHVLDPRKSFAFQELRCDMTGDEFKIQKKDLEAWDDQGITPADPAAAKAVLLEIMDAAIERLRVCERERQEFAETVAEHEKEMLRHDETKAGEQIRRHQGSCGRLVARNIEVIRRGHRDEDRGSGRVREERARRKEERRKDGEGDKPAVVDELGFPRDAKEAAGTPVEFWPGYQAEVEEVRRRRQRELDAGNAARVDYARWKPPVVEEQAVVWDALKDGMEGVEVEGAAMDKADVIEAISARDDEEGGVTALTLEDQGEGANLQNGFSSGPLPVSDGQLSQMKNAGAGETVVEGGVGGRADADDALCGGEPCRSGMEDQLDLRKRQFDRGERARGGEDRPLERLSKREKRRRRRALKMRGCNHAPNLTMDGKPIEEVLDRVQWMIPNGVKFLRDHYGLRDRRDVAPRGDEKSCEGGGSAEPGGYG